ncbi:hypothetical protein HA402_012805 [Bradysia odoriphaga]|nr:hypothetical protein HA402_012805 [Bradysia odoriphaga]
MSVQLDPREVLAHLNSMGYRNISAEILKEFMKNLKRLITYETRYSLQSPQNNNVDPAAHLNKKDIQNHFEKLYRTTTEATKARISARSKRADRENDNPYDPYKFDRIRVDEDAAREIPKKQCSVAVSQQKRNSHNVIPSKISENVVKRSQSARPASTTPSYYIRNTPTDLYQNYQREWSRFKHLLPGEHPRFSERQVIRKRMETIQKSQTKPKVFVLMNDDNTKVIRRTPSEYP